MKFKNFKNNLNTISYDPSLNVFSTCEEFQTYLTEQNLNNFELISKNKQEEQAFSNVSSQFISLNPLFISMINDTRENIEDENNYLNEDEICSFYNMFLEDNKDEIAFNYLKNA